MHLTRLIAAYRWGIQPEARPAEPGEEVREVEQKRPWMLIPVDVPGRDKWKAKKMKSNFVPLAEPRPPPNLVPNPAMPL